MNRKPLNPITEKDILDYERDGVVCLRGMFDQDWIERVTPAVDRLMAGASRRSREAVKDGESGRFHVSTFGSRWDPDLLALVMQSPAAEIGARLMRQPEVRFFYDQLFVKEPGTQAVTHWHHDLPYWPFRGGDIASIWIALTPVTRETSGLEYVAGSHKWGKFFKAITPDEDPAYNSDLEPCPDFSLDENRTDQTILSWSLEAGDVIVHHPLTVHGAGGNASVGQRRIGLSVRYIGRDARWDPRPATLPVEGDPKLAPGDHPSKAPDIFPVVWSAPKHAAAE